MAGNAVVVKFSGDTSRLEQSLDKVHSSLGGFGSAVAKVGAVIGGAFVADKAFDFAKGAVAAARESNEIAKVTEATIKATGAAAGLTADQIGDLANSLSRKTGIDDEVIQTGENQLLTFKAIHNEVGKGNDIFNRATAAALDLSAHGFGSVESASVMLGKALNDPVKGITALQRVGVSLTEQQKEQVKALVASGDTLGAQKIILREVEAQVGGTAEATATSGKKFSVAIGNIQESLGNALIPVLDKVTMFLADKLPGAIAFVSDVFGKASAVVKAFVYTLTTGFTEDEGTPIENFALKVRDLWDQLQPFVQWLEANWKPVLIGVGIAIGLVAAPLLTLAAAAVYAYTQFEPVRAVVDAVAAALVSFGTAVAEQVGNLIAYFQSIAPAVGEAMGHVQTVIQDVLTVIIGLWHTFGDNIIGFLTGMWEVIRGIVDTGVRVIRDIINFVLALINGDWGKAWEAIRDIPAAILSGLKAVIGGLLRELSAVLSGAMDGIKFLWGVAWDGLKTAASGVLDAVVGFVRSLPGRILDAAKALPGLLVDTGRGLMNGLADGVGAVVEGVAGTVGAATKRVINAVIGGINGMIDVVNGLDIPLPKVHIPGTNVDVGGGSIGLPSIPHIPKLHIGGVFRAPPGRSEGLAMLLDGERVVPRSRAGTGDAGQVTVTNHFYGPVDSSTLGPLTEQFQDALIRALRAA